MTSTVVGNDIVCVGSGIDCCWKWQQLFQMATTVYEREISDLDRKLKRCGVLCTLYRKLVVKVLALPQGWVMPTSDRGKG